MSILMEKERNFLIHPSYILMFLLLAGITSLFLGFSGAYLYNRIQQEIPPIELPSLFYFNTLILIASSIVLKWAKQAYLNDNTRNYKIALLVTLVLTICFLISQIFAWQQLQASDIFVNYNNMASYMYLISGLHFAHVVAGIPFLVIFVVNAVRKMKSPVSVLIYFSDLKKKRRLDLFNIYWHFLDGLWIYLVLFFLINYLIQ
ncbi:MAG: cytochrome c oxidase subunit 3 [Saprospiraceae bacterium]|nr:cytochrome c oxidase subunit 3 [Saprospiraceae bacterium]